MKKILVFTILLGLFGASKGQDIDFYKNNVFPPSPEVLAITKHGNIPVGYETGIPQISIPIYSYNQASTGLALDISLNYHAGGIKVDELASNVGIGWNLNAGHLVSRTVMGCADESHTGFWSNEVIDYQTANDYGNEGVSKFQEIQKGYRDSQMDIFSYSINGRSGHFVWGKNDELFIQNDEKLKISKRIDTSELCEITIIDEKGFKYIFSATEKTFFQGAGGNYPVYNTAWYVSKIYSPTGIDFIDFQYTDVYYDFPTSTGYSEGKILEFPVGNYENISWHRNTVYGKRLSKILFPNGVNVDFTYDTNKRTDLGATNDVNSENFALKKISVSTYTEKKEFMLEHDYSTNRLTLKKINLLSSDAQKIADYRFEYENPLPNRISAYRDHWGFCNGPGQMTHQRELLHQEKHLYNGKVYTIGTGNRDTNKDYTKLGSLKRIYYPTGGYTDFVWGANEAIVRDLKVFEPANNYDDASTGFSAGSKQTVEFTSKGTPSNTEYTITVTTFNQNPANIYFYYKIWDGTQCILSNSFSLAGSTTQYTNRLNTALVSGRKYRLEVQATQSNPASQSIFVALSVKGHFQPPRIEELYKTMYVGGIRIEKMLDYDGVSSTPIMVKEYEYMDNGRTSGSIGNQSPKYSNLRDNIQIQYRKSASGASRIGETTKAILEASSSTLFPLCQLNGSPVIYTKVREYLTAKGTPQGYTDRYYTDKRLSVMNTRFPSTPPVDNSWSSGLIDSLCIYDRNGRIVYGEYYKYDISQGMIPGRGNLESVVIGGTTYYSIVDVGQIPISFNWSLPVFYTYQVYTPQRVKKDLLSKKVVDYLSTGSKVITSKTYTYHTHNKQLQSETVINSNNQTIISNYLYPQDIISKGEDNSDTYQRMVNQGLIGYVIENTQTVNGTQTVLNRTNYYNPATNMFLPRSFEKTVGTGAIYTLLTCDSYTSNGQILSYTNQNGQIVTILWGYNNQIPVAKIIGADYNTSVSFLTASELANLNSTGYYNDQSMESILNKIRTGFIHNPHVRVHTYTHNPLSGITSETDATGKTIYYSYDIFCRLMEKYITHNTQKQVIETYNYNYKTR